MNRVNMMKRRMDHLVIMLTYLLVLLIIKIAYCQITPPQAINENLHLYCNESQFIDDFYKTGRTLDNSTASILKTCSSHLNSTCPTLQLQAKYTLNDSFDQWTTIFSHQNGSVDQDCWGYYLQVRDPSSNMTNTSYHGIGSMSMEILFDVVKISTRRLIYTLTTIPTMATSTVETASADSCTLDGVSYVFKVNREFFHNCGNDGYLSLLHLSASLCLKFPDSRERELKLSNVRTNKQCQFSLQESIQNEQHRQEESNSLCSKNKFIEDYVKTNTALNMSYLNQLKECNVSLSCVAPTIMSYLTFDTKWKWDMILEGLNSTNNRGCWGFYIRVSYGEDLKSEAVKYINFNESETRSFTESLDASTTGRKYYAYGIPSARYSVVTLTKLSEQCTTKTLRVMRKKMKQTGFEEKCRKELDDSGTNIKFLKKIAKIICQKYPYRPEKDSEQMQYRKHEVKTFFNFDFKSCVFSYSGSVVFNNATNTTGVLLNHIQKNPLISDTSVALITVSSILLLILLTSATIWMIHRHRQNKARKLCMGCARHEKSKLRTTVRYTEEAIVINRHTNFHDTI